MGLETKMHYDEDFNSQDYGVFLDGVVIFGAQKYVQEGYSTAFWSVAAKLPLIEYLKKMHELSAQIESGGYLKNTEKLVGTLITDMPIRVVLSAGEDTSDFIADSDFETKEILSAQKIADIAQKKDLTKDVFVIRIDTPYFGCSIEQWQSGIYSLSVLSHQDISKQVADFFESTNQNGVKAESVRSIFKDIYTFGNQELPAKVVD